MRSGNIKDHSRKLQTTKALAEARERAPDLASRSNALAALQRYTSIYTIHKKLTLQLKNYTSTTRKLAQNFWNSERELCTFSGSLIHPRLFFSSSRCLGNTKRSEGRTRKINKKGIRVRDRVSSARVASRWWISRVWTRRRSAEDWRARRRRSCRGGQWRPVTWRPAPAQRLFTNNNNRAGGAASTPRPATRYELRTAVVAFGGIRFGAHSLKASASICLLGAFALAFYRSIRNFWVIRVRCYNNLLIYILERRKRFYFFSIGNDSFLSYYTY